MGIQRSIWLWWSLRLFKYIKLELPYVAIPCVSYPCQWWAPWRSCTIDVWWIWFTLAEGAAFPDRCAVYCRCLVVVHAFLDQKTLCWIWVRGVLSNTYIPRLFPIAGPFFMSLEPIRKWRVSLPRLHDDWGSQMVYSDVPVLPDHDLSPQIRFLLFHRGDHAGNC